MNVKNVVIGKQFEICNNYKMLIDIVKNKNINIIIVEAGQRINIEENLYFDILWPDSQNAIYENTLNNNSLVCKLVYKNFSVLFTGDIEKIAEEALLQKYKSNLHILNATVLKVAHHGSNTSSTKEFLEAVSPRIALIGVGKDNKFGHPSKITLKSFEKMKCKIFRTDEDGEIIIGVDRKGKIIKVNKYVE